jgi:ABC-type microcin C transport system duplicated ATPase subunit YejF
MRITRPYASLNPRMKVNDIIAEGIDVNGLAKTPKEREEKVNELLKTVGLNRHIQSRNRLITDNETWINR